MEKSPLGSLYKIIISDKIHQWMHKLVGKFEVKDICIRIKVSQYINGKIASLDIEI